MANAPTKVRKGSHKVANTRRSEHRRNRYLAGLRTRISALNARAKRGEDVSVKLAKLNRLLDNNPQTRGRYS